MLFKVCVVLRVVLSVKASKYIPERENAWHEASKCSRMRWNSALCKPMEKFGASPQQEYLRPTFYFCTLSTFSLLPLLLPSKHATKHSPLESPFLSVNHRPRMRPLGDAVLKRWHRMLGLSRQSPPSWNHRHLGITAILESPPSWNHRHLGTEIGCEKN